MSLTLVCEWVVGHYVSQIGRRDVVFECLHVIWAGFILELSLAKLFEK